MIKMLAVVQELDKPNLNGRLYPSDVMENAAKRFSVPANNSLKYTVNKLYVKDGQLLGEIEIYDEQMMNEVCVKANVGFRPSGVGDVDENGVISNYTLTSIDYVNNPA